MKLHARIALAFALVLGLPASSWAVAYKNPGHDFRVGRFSAGVIVESSSRDLVSDKYTEDIPADTSLVMAAFGFGLSPAMVIEPHAGVLSSQTTIGGTAQDRSDGVILGAAFRLNVSRILGGDGGGIQHGLVAEYHYANIGNDVSETDVYQTDVGYGVWFPVSEIVGFYAGGVLSSVSGTTTPNNYLVSAYDFDSKTDTGAFGGVQLRFAASVLLGVEVHLLNETSVGFHFDGRFGGR